MSETSVGVRYLLLNSSISTRVPAAGERGSPLLVPLHPGPENGHPAARRRRLRGEGGEADEEVRTEHFSHAGSPSVRHAGTTSANRDAGDPVQAPLPVGARRVGPGSRCRTCAPPALLAKEPENHSLCSSGTDFTRNRPLVWSQGSRRIR